MNKFATLLTIATFVLGVQAIACDDGSCEHHKGAKSCESKTCEHHSAKHDEKSEFRQKIDGQLDQIESQLNELKTKTSTASSDAKAGLDTRIAKLEQRRDEIRAEVDKMSATSGKAWTKFKTGLQKAVGELQTGFEDAKSEFDKKTEAKK